MPVLGNSQMDLIGNHPDRKVKKSSSRTAPLRFLAVELVERGYRRTALRAPRKRYQGSTDFILIATDCILTTCTESSHCRATGASLLKPSNPKLAWVSRGLSTARSTGLHSAGADGPWASPILQPKTRRIRSEMRLGENLSRGNRGGVARENSTLHLLFNPGVAV